jgi:hypothetical protein
MKGKGKREARRPGLDNTGSAKGAGYESQCQARRPGLGNTGSAKGAGYESQGQARGLV